MDLGLGYGNPPKPFLSGKREDSGFSERYPEVLVSPGICGSRTREETRRVPAVARDQFLPHQRNPPPIYSVRFVFRALAATERPAAIPIHQARARFLFLSIVHQPSLLRF